jgi:tetrapyrrole methylase family protein/MazG family protein
LTVDALSKLVETLRGEDGCPWDKKQTPLTISVYLVEEIYELVDAIESGSPDEVCEELGDVLFHILFLVSLFQEMGRFNIREVVRVITEKMIRRHPHVFGNDSVTGPDEVRHRWHRIKLKEKSNARPTSALDSVPKKLPALMRAYRISERAARTGFDWTDISGVVQKVEEEWSEFKAKLSQTDPDGLAMEFGDILFTLVNIARFARFHPETALTGSIKKFEKRFKYMEKVLSENGKSLESISDKEMDTLWEEAKKKIDSY